MCVTFFTNAVEARAKSTPTRPLWEEQLMSLHRTQEQPPVFFFFYYFKFLKQGGEIEGGGEKKYMIFIFIYENKEKAARVQTLKKNLFVNDRWQLRMS